MFCQIRLKTLFFYHHLMSIQKKNYKKNFQRTHQQIQKNHYGKTKIYIEKYLLKKIKPNSIIYSS